MTDVVQFALLGLGIGSIYGLLACGLVLIYRGSGTINFAHGHLAILAAYLMIELRDNRQLPTVLAIVLVVVMTAALGALIHLLIMRPLRMASPLARVIATLAILTIINEVITLRFGVVQQATEPVLSTKVLTVGSVVFGRQSLYLAAVVVVAAAVLTLASGRTRLGLAVSAAAENARAAGALGWSADMLAVATWSLGGALAGIAGVLVPAATSGFFAVGSLSLLIVGALAAALFAEFTSFPRAVLAGWFVAIAQSEAVRFVDVTGASDAVPLLFVVLILVLRGRGLPVRGTITDRLPSVGTGRVRPVLVLALTVLAIAVVRSGLDASYLQAIVTSVSIGIVALSVVVLTGYAGQLSLAQMGLAGVGAYAAGRLVAAHGWTFGPGLVAGIVVAAAAGLVFGLPALRTRGVNLTVVTFCMGFALFAVLFSSSELTGGNVQTQIKPQKLFGVEIDPIGHLDNYASLSILLFVVAALCVANLRRGAAGRRLLAVRLNERAAASVGVNVFATKLYAFSLAAGIAGLGGVLLAFSYTTILYPTLFGPFSSIAVMTIAVIGGVGWALGPAWGVGLASGGIGVVVTSKLLSGSEQYVPLAGGVLLILLLIINQNGIAAAVANAVPSRLRGTRPRPRKENVADQTPVDAKTLRISGLTQRFGGVTALKDVDLVVAPGKVLGLLGPNGAGKTTLIDAVTGYAKPEGRVHLGDDDITDWSASRRARAGLGRTFQSLELFDDLTVRENLLAACDRRTLRSYVSDLVWPGTSRLSAAAHAAVQELELEPVLDRLPEELSYGQRRLVAIARSVAMGPSVLLLDEPGAGLDETETAELGHLIRRLADEWGIAILLIEHDVAMVLRTSDEVHVLEFGQTIFTGAPTEVSQDERVRTAYLGATATEHGATG